MTKKYPTQAELKELFDYHPDGYLVWRPRSGDKKWNAWNAKHAGKMAGEIKIVKNHTDYMVQLNKQYYTGQSLVWVMHYGDYDRSMFRVFVSRNPTGICKIDELSLVHKSEWNKKVDFKPSKSREYIGVSKLNSGNYISGTVKHNDYKVFHTALDAATHFDNISEIANGCRVNGTKRRKVTPVVCGVSSHIAMAQKAKEKGGFVGVYKNKNRWIAKALGRHVGSFSTETEAARAYNIAAYEKYGEHAVLNDIPDPLGKGDAF